MDRDWKYVVIWEFHVQAGVRDRFEEAYGSNGVWARLFESGVGYARTELIRDVDQTGRYITLDFWASREAFETFREANRGRYHALDKECEAFTESEKRIGEFERLG